MPFGAVGDDELLSEVHGHDPSAGPPPPRTRRRLPGAAQECLATGSAPARQRMSAMLLIRTCLPLSTARSVTVPSTLRGRLTVNVRSPSEAWARFSVP